MIELKHRAVISDHGSGVLLLASDRNHFRIAASDVRAGAGTACTIGTSDAAEPEIIAREAFQDAVKRHEFEIVLMGTDAEVSDAFQSLRDGCLVGDENFRCGMVQPHEFIFSVLEGWQPQRLGRPDGFFHRARGFESVPRISGSLVS